MPAVFLPSGGFAYRSAAPGWSRDVGSRSSEAWAASPYGSRPAGAEVPGRAASPARRTPGTSEDRSSDGVPGRPATPRCRPSTSAATGPGDRVMRRPSLEGGTVAAGRPAHVHSRRRPPRSPPGVSRLPACRQPSAIVARAAIRKAVRGPAAVTTRPPTSSRNPVGRREGTTSGGGADEHLPSARTAPGPPRLGKRFLVGRPNCPGGY
jgi:hypothetical protein